MLCTNDYVPASCKIGLALNATAIVRQSENFTAMNAHAAAYIQEVQSGLAKFAIEAHALNNKATRKELIQALCLCLHISSVGFLAKHGTDTARYGPHQAVLDLLALHPDKVTSILSVPISTLLCNYKEVHGLTALPIPKMPYNFERVLQAINNPPMQGAMTDAAASAKGKAIVVSPPQQATPLPAAAKASEPPLEALKTPLPGSKAATSFKLLSNRSTLMPLPIDFTL